MTPPTTVKVPTFTGGNRIETAEKPVPCLAPAGSCYGST
jgi:hypothetical protein